MIGFVALEEEEERSFSPLAPPLPPTHQRKAMWGYTKKSGICNPRRVFLPDINPINTLILDCQSLQLWEVSFSCLSHPVKVFCYGSLCGLKQSPSHNSLIYKKVPSWFMDYPRHLVSPFLSQAANHSSKVSHSGSQCYAENILSLSVSSTVAQTSLWTDGFSDRTTSPLPSSPQSLYSLCLD